MRELEEDRQHWQRTVEDGRQCAARDEQVVDVGDTYVKLRVPGFDGQTMYESFIDLYDYGRMSVIVGFKLGSFYVRQFSGYPVLAANKTQKNGEYNNSATYVHTVITDKLGFRHFKNGNTLDCRRTNLATDSDLRTEVPPELIGEDRAQSEIIQQQIGQLHDAMGKAPEA